MTSPEPRERLPFEPAQKRKKKSSKAASSSSPEKQQQAAPERPSRPKNPEASLSAIPDAVSRRMVRRMAILCGLPTALGIGSFVIAYIIVSRHWFDLPTSAVALVSMGCFGLGVIGLSYGTLSASWDEERVGTLVGWEEFTTNCGRLLAAWRSRSSANRQGSSNPDS